MEILEKLEIEMKEMESISSVLKGVMRESDQDELGETQEKSIEMLDADIDN